MGYGRANPAAGSEATAAGVFPGPRPGAGMCWNAGESVAPAIQQYVWGLMYVDELAQIWTKHAPPISIDGYYDYVLQDANYNVIGLYSPNTGGSGTLVERYEYTPYGQRTVFANAEWLAGDANLDGTVGPEDFGILKDHFDGSCPSRKLHPLCRASEFCAAVLVQRVRCGVCTVAAAADKDGGWVDLTTE